MAVLKLLTVLTCAMAFGQVRRTLSSELSAAGPATSRTSRSAQASSLGNWVRLA